MGDDDAPWAAAHQDVSWLNQVEIWFNIITQRAIRRGTFRSVRDLVEKINRFVRESGFTSGSSSQLPTGAKTSCSGCRPARDGSAVGGPHAAAVVGLNPWSPAFDDRGASGLPARSPGERE